MNSKKFLEFKTVVNLLPEHVYWLDKNHVYQGGNVKWLSFFNLKKLEQLIGKKNSDFIEAFTQETLENLDKNNQAVFDNKKAICVEETICRKNAGKLTFLSHKIPLYNRSGDVFGLLGISTDITEIKNHGDSLKQRVEQAELTIDNIVANMPGHVYWKDVHGVYLGCNNLQAQSLGLASGDEVLGKTDFDLPWKVETARTFRDNDIRIMQSELPETIEEIAQVNGKEAIVISRKTPLKSKSGEVMGILGISIDITDRKQFEKDLKIAKEAAEVANHAKSEFLNNMRHDLRTPFTGILGLAELLESQETNPEKKETLGYIVESAQALLEHLNEIFEFVQVESGQLPLLDKQFDIHQLLSDLFDMMLPVAKDKKIDFTFTKGSNLPQFLMGDRIRVQRILMNLVSNAIKFTQKGHVKVEAGVVENSEKVPLIYFKIEDTGIGIPQDKCDLIFERFNRLTPSYTGVYPGKGLGLRIVKQFLEEIGGEFHLESALEKGTTFTVLMPYKPSLFIKML